MRVVPVRFGARGYRIRIVRGGLEGLAGSLVKVTGSRAVAIITDRNVAPLYAQGVADDLAREGCRPAIHVLKGVGEQAKKIGSATRAWRWLLESGFNRSAVVLALGGGVVGDVAAFVASTFMRGVDLVAAPTTLLAQVDSSVGGKTGFNQDGLKNVVGTFYQPRLVYAGLATLQTLHQRDYRAGMAEVIKHGVIAQEQILATIRADHAAISARRPRTLEPLVAMCCEVKRAVVEADEREAGPRRVLNFGHTFGHAIETWTGHRRRHGEAVALGMVSACRVSEKLGLCTKEVRQELCEVLDLAGLQSDDRPYWRPELVELMRRDKKARGDRVTFVVVRRMGEVDLVDVSYEELLKMVGNSPD